MLIDGDLFEIDYLSIMRIVEIFTTKDNFQRFFLIIVCSKGSRKSISHSLTSLIC